MSIGYVLTKTELKCIQKMMKNENDWNLNEEEAMAICHLLEVGYLSREKRTLYIEPVLCLLMEVIQNPKNRLKFDAGVLYEGKEMMLWQEEDTRRLDGIILIPYQTLYQWYEDKKEVVKSNLEEIRKELLVYG